ncbi:MAG: 6-bladed beta-propeller, partial [bacterium]
GLPSPVGVGALPDGRILVSDSRLGKILTFSSDGKLGGDFCKSDAVERPAGIVVNPTHHEVYVADVTRHCVVVFDFGGAVLRTIGKRGDGPVEFNFPTHLALGPDGSLAVTDSMNFRVQTVTPEGKFVRSVGRLGDAPGTLSKPKGVALDSEGNTIVAEGLYGALEFFDPNGQLLLNLGASGHGPGEFWLPAGLLFDTEQRLLFVADSYNNRVQVFRMLQESAP